MLFLEQILKVYFLSPSLEPGEEQIDIKVCSVQLTNIELVLATVLAVKQLALVFIPSHAMLIVQELRGRVSELDDSQVKAVQAFLVGQVKLSPMLNQEFHG